MRLLMTLDAAHSEISPATINTALGRAPIIRNWLSTRSSVPGGTTSERKPSSVLATKSARVCTRIVAAEVSTGKKDSRAEYAAPLAMLKQPSSNAAMMLRRRSQKNVRGVQGAGRGMAAPIPKLPLPENHFGNTVIVSAIADTEHDQVLAGSEVAQI